MEPVEALRRIAFLLERAHEPTYRVRAFRRAADLVGGLPPGDLQARVRAGALERLPGIGKVTAAVITEALAGEVPEYLRRLEAGDRPASSREPERAERAGPPGAPGTELEPEAAALRRALRGDLHTHSDWSDGGSPIEEMARTAIELGHDYIALTDHSPRLTVARGLSAERLTRQLDVVAELNQRLAPFRILTGIEVDILEDGGLDQAPELLDRLDVVVASVHSLLRMPAGRMTPRMLTAIANPHVNVLGHCTGRLVGGRGRPPSEFDPEAVFGACAEHGVAVEINSRPERLDPPTRLLAQAAEAGCRFSVDSDAHAPGQLDWQSYGCVRAARCGIGADRVVNTLDLPALVAWSRAGR